MSLKRILGTMLVSRLAGRGRSRAGLGTAAMLGGLGYRRRGGLGGKLGLAALGYMAYRAYQDHQARSPARAAGATGTAGAAGASRGGGLGGIGDMLQGLADQITGAAGGAQAAQSAQPTDADLRADAEAAERVDDDTALLLLRAMITAAYADGSLSTDERTRILQGIDEADPTDAERAMMEREIANPRALDDLLTEVRDQERAEQFYLASTAAIDTGTPANQRYLADLRRRLNISDDTASDVDAMAG